jgi:glycerophosphoryl diester phosphodiesterase
MLVLGHRGAILPQSDFYQNSLKAFDEALQTADGFETDACADSEGELFLIHEAKYVDPKLGVEYCWQEHLDEKSQNFVGKRHLDRFLTSEVKQLRLCDGSPLPTLRQMIARVGAQPGKIIDIELKGFNVVEPVVRVVRDSLQQKIIAPEAVILSSFNHPALAIARARLPQIKIGAIFVLPEQIATPLFPWKKGSAGRYMPLTEETLRDPLLKDIQPDYIVMPQEMMTSTTLSMVTTIFPATQVMGWVFTERDNFDFHEFVHRLSGIYGTGKIAGIMVDNPRQFSAMLPKEFRAS